MARRNRPGETPAPGLGKEADEAARQIRVESSFKIADALLWTVSVENLTDRPLEIADLGLPLPF